MYPLSCIETNSKKSLGKKLRGFSFCCPKCPNTFEGTVITIFEYEIMNVWRPHNIQETIDIQTVYKQIFVNVLKD